MSRRPKWQTYEMQQAKKHGGTHLGGPGKADYRRGGIEGEVKRHKNPLTKPQVQRECRKGRREIVSESGFTAPARKYAERYGHVKLIHDKREKSRWTWFDSF